MTALLFTEKPERTGPSAQEQLLASTQKSQSHYFMRPDAAGQIRFINCDLRGKMVCPNAFLQGQHFVKITLPADRMIWDRTFTLFP